MKRFELSLLLAMLFCVLLSFISFERECLDIRANILRLHVLANSDSAEDQQLKLAVRDRILTESVGIFSGCADINDAAAAAEARLEDIRRAAQDEVYARGYDYPVSVELDDQYFPTRTYEQVTLPAGVYKAFRVKIGSAQGRNWWCVMFPMLCVPGASDTEGLDMVLQQQQLDIVESSGYEVRFKCVELFEQLANEMRRQH
ncbi:MAG: stage II sporulation protein R [Ruminococcaceae bacterium]|nr:stage II sporulation protein R [Oscillospiraceae bacterium]